MKDLTNLDPTRGQAQITFVNAKAEPLGATGEGWGIVKQVLDRAAVLTAFERVLVAEEADRLMREGKARNIEAARQEAERQVRLTDYVDMIAGTAHA